MCHYSTQVKLLDKQVHYSTRSIPVSSDQQTSFKTTRASRAGYLLIGLHSASLNPFTMPHFDAAFQNFFLTIIYTKYKQYRIFCIWIFYIFSISLILNYHTVDVIKSCQINAVTKMRYYAKLLYSPTQRYSNYTSNLQLSYNYYNSLHYASQRYNQTHPTMHRSHTV